MSHLLRPLRRLTALLLLACAGLALSVATARADASQTSIMQDDQYLIDSGTPTMLKTLATMQRLGVQTVRVNLEWASIAPDASSTTEPANFDAADPAAYQAANPQVWAPYVALADAAPLYGISVQFNLTSPGPLWAMGANPPSARASTHWNPNPLQFFDFVYAVGQEFSGNVADVSRVGDWSIWNEPNQPGWLAPQWEKVGGRTIPESAVIYRSLVNDGFYGLAFSGHTTKTDTVLIGETAPEGANGGSNYTASTPLPFLETLYCVTARERPLRGAAARAAGCPTSGSVADFVHANAGLFDATGFAHHPYDFFKSPSYSWTSQPNYAPLSDIGRLETFLDRTFRAYGQHRQIPLYFTEYGYETNPPDPHQVVSPAQQAAYLNEADYMAWRNGRVRSMAQFLLYDSAPNPNYSPSQYDYWDTFQTGLLFVNGRPKPALAAYRMPIWLPQTHLTPGSRASIWGQVRPADALGAQTVTLQWTSGSGGWRTIASLRTGAHTGYFTARVKLPGSGYVRSSWTGPVGTGLNMTSGTFTSRRVAVLVHAATR